MAKKTGKKVQIEEPKKRNNVMLPILVLAIFAVLSLVFYLTNKKGDTVTSTDAQEESRTVIQLPKGWQEDTDIAADVNSKFIKKVPEKQFVPTVVLVESAHEIDDPKTYTTKLIDGAKSALPSLTISKDTSTETSGYFVRTIEGYYVDNGQYIGITQQLWVKGNTINTVSASYPQEDTESMPEAKQMMEYVIEKNFK